MVPDCGTCAAEVAEYDRCATAAGGQELKVLLLGLLFAAALPACAAPLVLRAEEFGAVGDGKTDDGPALQKMLAAAQKHNDAVELRFAPKTYFVATGQNRYALNLENARNWTIDGGGSLFLIDANLRFLRLSNCRDVTLRRCNVDYVPLPYAEGTIVAKNPAAGTIDVRIDEGFALPPLGGPTREDGEQAYFASLWHEGAYSSAAEPYFTRELLFLNEVGATDTPRVVRLAARGGADLLRRIEVDKWHASVPVRGVAHRYGPGETCQIIGNENVTLEDVEVHSAPWFAFGLSDNSGSVALRRVAVRPRPGSGRIASSWRDAFHVKNNAASLLFEDCTVQGSGDDAFNIACHTSSVKSVATTRVTVKQNFPLNIARWRVGDALAAYDPQRGVNLGEARIIAVRESKAGSTKPPVAPEFEIDLAAPLEDLQPGALVWNPATANPNTVLRRCRVDTSCRFRSPVTLENCRFNALAWFTGDEIEAPIPSKVTVRDCVFKLGQGNPNSVLVMDGPRLKGAAPSRPVIFDVSFENNTLWGDFRLGDAARVTLRNNHFADAKRAIIFENVQGVRLQNNRRGDAALQSPDGVQLRRSEATALEFLP